MLCNLLYLENESYAMYLSSYSIALQLTYLSSYIATAIYAWLCSKSNIITEDLLMQYICVATSMTCWIECGFEFCVCMHMHACMVSWY